ncbi:hypothetical protein QTH89_23090 [Variovorax sp. J22G21]|uniref:hypothetical protein n=1 Tax=Variovorax fucosicus TaxID=3053517 RepID=UPI002578DADD|nr:MULTISPECIES: hypothetical protein [unclassified Variovorax]MDM0039342.1 hypothetical protein [Variovorax sp. J22R193]MDM0064117.1 hypothetical protein [Variovorax sp. J22G21]
MKVINTAILPWVAAIALVGCGGGGGGGGGGGFSALGLAGTTAATGTSTGTGSTGTGGVVAGPAQPNDIADTSFTISPESYKAMAPQLSKDAGIAYRYGSASTASVGTEYFKRADIEFTAAQQPLAGNGTRTHWQVGGPPTVSADWYFSIMANAAFVADNPATSPGVSVYQQLAAGNNVLSQRPEVSWIYPEGIVDPNAANFKAQGLAANNPVAMGRCAGRPGWCVQGIVAYQSGLIANARGSNNALNQVTTQLEAGMVPTGVAVTNSGEFALVTVWDSVNVRGRVAVIALAGLCNSCTPAQPAKETFWGEWNATYPGLQNLGNYAFMKVVGYIELPDMKAPTEISATTGVNPWTGYGQTTADRDSLNLSTESNRQSFISGGNVNAYAKTGVAVVISKSERKATFIDLKPLFAYYKKMYFGTLSDFNQTKNVGQAANQWPFTFANTAEQVPTIIKTVSLANAPTAVKASLWNTPRAWIATQDGVLHTFGLGNYLSPTATGTASEVVETGSFGGIGANPTGLTYFRNTVGNAGNDINNKLIVVSRGERKVTWVDVNSGAVERTLQDKNLIDPITADDNEGGGTYAPVISIADYNGKAISNYRYGVLYLHPGFAACQQTAGGCPTINASGGAAPFEFGGSLALPGKAFMLAGSNVP